MLMNAILIWLMEPVHEICTVFKNVMFVGDIYCRQRGSH